MGNDAVHTILVLAFLVLAAAFQDMVPSFCGTKVPISALMVSYWAFSLGARASQRTESHAPWFRCMAIATVAGLMEDALSGFPAGCCTGYSILVATATLFAREHLEELSPMARGLVVGVIGAPLHELWLAGWGLAGDSTLLVGFFASSLPAAVAGMLVFRIVPRLEIAAGIYDADRGGVA